MDLSTISLLGEAEKGDVMPSPEHLAGEEMNKSSGLIHFCVTSFSIIDWPGVKLTKKG